MPKAQLTGSRRPVPLPWRSARFEPRSSLGGRLSGKRRSRAARPASWRRSGPWPRPPGARRQRLAIWPGHPERRQAIEQDQLRWRMPGPMRANRTGPLTRSDRLRLRMRQWAASRPVPRHRAAVRSRTRYWQPWPHASFLPSAR